MENLPRAAAWLHCGARIGFEVVITEPAGDGHRIDGQSSGVEGGEPWQVSYAVRLDERGRSRFVRVTGRSALGSHVVELESDGEGGWRRDGEAAPELDGCLDIDLEASAFTNAFPVRRLRLGIGEAADARAAWVRTFGLAVEVLDQRYARIEDDGELRRYDYAAPGLGFHARLVHDGAGLGLEYPGLAVRAL